MRRIHFYWTYLTLGIVLSLYGGYSLIYHAAHNHELTILGLVFFIFGSVMLLLYLVLYLMDYFHKKKNPPQEQVIETTVEEVKPEVIEEIKEEPKEEKPAPQFKKDYSKEVVYERSRPSRSFDGDSGYVKLVGYGPVLRVDDERIYDMRNNIYYRIEGNIVKMEGSGPVFELSRNRIRAAFGNYLYEISGNNVNKIFGGYYASFSGGYLTTYDLKEKYEVPSMMNMAQKLAVVALLFGTY